ncbi:hypothetical protein AGMMS50293_20190 [Spirochaetia bacterium]|nr:hypothetical protein AGMMS50293_20190 [Spirochaetia bacterium]
MEAIPSTKATDAVREQTTAEWLEGIPPVRQIAVSIASRSFLRRLVSKKTNIFRSWAVKRLEVVDKNIVFSNKSFRDAAFNIV